MHGVSHSPYIHVYKVYSVHIIDPVTTARVSAWKRKELMKGNLEDLIFYFGLSTYKHVIGVVVTIWFEGDSSKSRY